MTPIEYECDGRITIRRCAPATFPWGVSPEYWYIHRPMFSMDAAGIGWDHNTIKSWKDAGFNVAYWSGEQWGPSTPKQYATAQEAYDKWHARKNAPS